MRHLYEEQSDVGCLPGGGGRRRTWVLCIKKWPIKTLRPAWLLLLGCKSSDLHMLKWRHEPPKHKGGEQWIQRVIAEGSRRWLADKLPPKLQDSDGEDRESCQDMNQHEPRRQGMTPQLEEDNRSWLQESMRGKKMHLVNMIYSASCAILLCSFVNYPLMTSDMSIKAALQISTFSCTKQKCNYNDTTTIIMLWDYEATTSAVWQD